MNSYLKFGRIKVLKIAIYIYIVIVRKNAHYSQINKKIKEGRGVLVMNEKSLRIANEKNYNIKLLSFIEQKT